MQSFRTRGVYHYPYNSSPANLALVDHDYPDETDYPIEGCIYELATVGGAITLTTIVVVVLWNVVGWLLTAMIN